ncbi:SET domain-containing protein [Lentithecium fluviatile CBS 122367]|uniref:SET domain-containing protein n=1 Tax=Lentithecium fluviatile CBS 122367 TaxID=1168545 RepID=A0A6G1J8D9_9PLEO|nr:SET domain-containing protein [Lentithecium fluviatile CBS 122367]
MIRRGRAEGWLNEPIEALPTWATFRGVKFDGIKVGPLPGFEHRGSTVIADLELVSSQAPLMTVPKEMILSRENIELFAKSDHHLRELLHSLGTFAYSTRGTVLIFLLMQATLCCPGVKDVGVRNPLVEYVKFLPDELLPTFWTEEELELLIGTTLRPAVRAKMNSLLREFETVRTATETIDWCAKYWWHEENGLITFDDWMQVDAMYRSRALEFPGVGDAMVPCIDMANHASGDATAALYETDEEGNAVLLLREGKEIQQGREITITYGDEKGACEIIFSYGFLEDTMTSAKAMFIHIEIPDDDPLRPAKLHVSTTAPGFRLFDKEGTHVAWDSEFIWLVVINEEDGLEFKVLQTTDGKREIQAFWKQQELNDTSLRSNLETDPLWDVYQLRAVVLLQDRVESQITTLREVGSPERGDGVRQGPWELAARLRTLELDMLQRALSTLESQRAALLDSDTVQRYLGLIDDNENQGEDEQVDFS